MNGAAKSRHLAPLVAGVLVVLGLVALACRLEVRRRVRLADDDTCWRITYRLAFHASRTGATLSAAAPQDTPFARVFRRDVQPDDRSQRLPSARETPGEIAIGSLRGGRHTLAAQFDVHCSPKGAWHPRDTDVSLTAARRAQYLHSTEGIPSAAPWVLDTLCSLRALPPAEGNDLVQRVFDYCARDLEHVQGGMPCDPMASLGESCPSPPAQIRVFMALCRAAGWPARLVTGFALQPASDLKPRHWAEVWLDERWIPFDPVAGAGQDRPDYLVPVVRDRSEIICGTDVTEIEAAFGLIQLPAGPGARRLERRGFGALFDLTELPLDMHEPLALLLLMPLGALVTTLFRTVIGIRTYGTFTPTLLALSFVYADWIGGLLTLAVVLGIGLCSRALLGRLKLLVVPRLSAMLTLVVLCIVLMVSVLDYFNLASSAQAVILPMVILTMTIERFFLTCEEDSTGFALQLLGTTLLVGACCYGVLRWNVIGRFVFNFPEIHCFTIAVLLLLGRYAGYRLTELWRFRHLP